MQLDYKLLEATAAYMSTWYRMVLTNTMSVKLPAAEDLLYQRLLEGATGHALFYEQPLHQIRMATGHLVTTSIFNHLCQLYTTVPLFHGASNIVPPNGMVVPNTAWLCQQVMGKSSRQGQTKPRFGVAGRPAHQLTPCPLGAEGTAGAVHG